MFNRGEIWLANLEPRFGTEPGKTRPILIIQAQVLLEVGHPSTLIIPITTNIEDNAEPLRIRISPSGKLKHPSDLIIDQLRAIDNRRIIKGPVAKLSPSIMNKVENAILDVLDIIK